MPDSASSEPGCGVSCIVWNGKPVFQSQNVMEPLSPPEKSAPSSLTLMVLMMASCPLKLLTKMPSGHFHFLMLLPPDEAEANEYSVGWMASDRTDLWWWVSCEIVLPAARSHNLRDVLVSSPVNHRKGESRTGWSSPWSQ